MSSFHATACPAETSPASRAAAARLIGLPIWCPTPDGSRTRPCRGGPTVEPLEVRRLAGGMIAGLPGGDVTVGRPSASDELVAGLLGRGASAARFDAAPDLPFLASFSTGALTAEDDPLSATGDPAPSAAAKKPPPTVNTMMAEGIHVRVSVYDLEGSDVHEGSPGAPGWFRFEVTSTCEGSEDWPTSAYITWSLGGQATPVDDYYGEILNGSRTIQLTNGYGYTDEEFVAIDDENTGDEPVESIEVTVNSISTCGGTVLSQQVAEPSTAYGFVDDGDVTFKIEVQKLHGGPTEESATVTLDADSPETHMASFPKQSLVKVLVTQKNATGGNSPAANVSVKATRASLTAGYEAGIVNPATNALNDRA